MKMVNNYAAKETFFVFLALATALILKVLASTHFFLMVHVFVYFMVLIAFWLFSNLPSGTFPTVDSFRYGKFMTPTPGSTSTSPFGVHIGSDGGRGLSKAKWLYSFRVVALAMVHWMLMCTIFEQFQHVGPELWYGLTYRNQDLSMGESHAEHDARQTQELMHAGDDALVIIGNKVRHLSVWYHYLRDGYCLVVYVFMPMFFINHLNSKIAKEKHDVELCLKYYSTMTAVSLGLGSLMWLPLYAQDNFYALTVKQFFLKVVMFVPMHYYFQLFHYKACLFIQKKLNSTGSSGSLGGSHNQEPGEESQNQSVIHYCNLLHSAFYLLYSALFMMPYTMSFITATLVTMYSYRKISTMRESTLPT